jgi:hypothetical protein
MFIDPLPTRPTQWRGFTYVIDYDRSNRRRRSRPAYRVLVTDPKTGCTYSIGHGHTSVVQAGQFARQYIEAIANTREGWNHG